MKYRTVIIDPPWKLSPCNPKNSRHGGSAFLLNSIPKRLPYQTMTDKEINNFPINDFAAAECDLFLWTTNSKLPIAFNILESWGFHYANLLVWNKGDGLNHQGVHLTLVKPNGNAVALKIPQDVEKVWFFKHYTIEDNVAAGMRFVFGNRRVRNKKSGS